MPYRALAGLCKANYVHTLVEWAHARLQYWRCYPECPHLFPEVSGSIMRRNAWLFLKLVALGCGLSQGEGMCMRAPMGLLSVVAGVFEAEFGVTRG